jgi:hypothetical protein
LDLVYDLEPQFGGKVYEEVQVNCPQPDPPSKVISVDGTPVSIVDPEPNYISCAENMDIRQSNRSCYVVGNHQMLLFGLFTERSIPVHPLDRAANENVVIHDQQVHPISPFRDIKVVKTCSDANSMCVLSDGFSGDIGSTIQWHGHIHGNDAVYANGSVTSIFDLHSLQLRTVGPCRTYDASKGDVIVMEHPLVDAGSCTFTWLTDGIDMHNQCLKWTNDPPSAGWAYAAARMGDAYTGDAFDKYFLCSQLMDINFAKSVHITGEYNLVQYLPKENIYGTFIGIETQEEFVDDFNTRITHLNMHGFLDDDTDMCSCTLCLEI